MKFERHPEKHEQLGVGAYKRAYKIEQNGATPDVQLVMKHHYANEQMKGLFYLNKLATLLFPGKIAKVKASGNFLDEDGEVTSSQFRAKYYEHDPVHGRMQHHTKVFDGKYVAENDDQQDSLEVFHELSTDRDRLMRRHSGIEEFLDAYRAAGFENENGVIQIGWGPQDVIIDEKGNFIYVDIDVPWDEPEDVGQSSYTHACLRFDPKKLQAAIDGIADNEIKAKTQVYYDRLLDQARQAGFDL